MRVRALLAELEAAGVHLTRHGGDLRFQTRPGVTIAPYRERILADKPALLAALKTQHGLGRLTSDEAAALGLDPTLDWTNVYRSPVEASILPDGWEGIAPVDCGVPNVCTSLGPCPHFTEHGHCWAGGSQP